MLGVGWRFNAKSRTHVKSFEFTPVDLPVNKGPVNHMFTLTMTLTPVSRMW